MKAKIEAKGYIVNSVDINIADDESYTIEGITLDLENVEEEKSGDTNNVTSTGETKYNETDTSRK